MWPGDLEAIQAKVRCHIEVPYPIPRRC
jgi:hypothetical protein